MRRDRPVNVERALFGPMRTLNVRANLMTGDESSARVESWLRSKQVELSGDVLVITGRGAGSIGGVPVIKNATIRVLNRLKRLGVIIGYGEDTPGSFVVSLAPLRSMLEAPPRRKTPVPTAARQPARIEGLRSDIRERLRYLAGRAIDALGVKNATESQVSAEMARQFSIIVRTAPAGADTDRWLDAAITRALQDYTESDR